MNPPTTPPSVAAPGTAVPGDGFARALFDQSPLSTVVYDAAGHIIVANAAFERLFGLRVTDIPRSYSVVDDPQLAAQGMQPDVRRAFAGDTVVLPPVRYSATPSLGVTTNTWTQAHFYPLRDGAGTVTAVVLVHMDLTARVDAEESLRTSEARLRVITDAAAALASSLDYERTLATVARLAVPALADYCIIDLLDASGTALRRVATAHADPERDALLAEVRRFPPPIGSTAVVARTLRTRAPQIVSPLVDVETDAATAEQPEHAALLRQLRPEAALCVPLIARDVTLGTMLLVAAGSGRRYGPADVPVAEELARRAALAVDNARLHHDALTAREAAEQQAGELEVQTELLQDQTIELETQKQELAGQVEEAAVLTEELREANDLLTDARAAAELDRERAERAASDVEAILASIGDPFVVYDRDWKFRYINAAAREIFRHSNTPTAHGDLLGRVVWDAYPDIVASGFGRAMRRADAERVPVTVEDYYARGGAWSEIRCYPMPDGGIAISWNDITARKRATEAEHFLGEATAIIASSLDYEVTLAAIARLLVPQLADWCSVDLVGDDGAIARVAVAHVDPDKVRWAHEIHRRFPPDPNAASGVPNVIRTGQPEMVREISDALLAANIADPEYLALLRQVGLRSVIIVPLVARGRTLGALSLVAAESGRCYDDADLQLAVELARRAALAVDNARLHRAALESERAAAEHAADVERFRRAQESSPDAFALFEAVRDAEGRIVDFVWTWANAAGLRVQDATLDELRGQRMLVRNPGIGDTALFADYARATDTGRPFEDEVHYRHEWIDTWFRITAVPLGDGLAVTFADVTARKRAERRATALYEFTRALGRAETRAAIGAVVLDHALPVLGAASGSLVEYDAARAELAIVAARGYESDAMRLWQRYPLTAGTPGADAIQTGELVTIATRAEWQARYPDHVAWAESAGVEGSVVVPLRLGDRTLGIIALQVRGPRTFTAEERQFLLAFADQCAQALERLRLFEAERRARVELTRVFDQSPIAIALTRGAEHVFHIANSRYEELVGRTSLVGLPVRAALPELDGQGMYELLDRVLQTGDPYVATETLLQLDRGPGGAREAGWFTFIFQPVSLGGDVVDGIAIVASDVTPQVRARLDADRLREAAEAANRSKTEFLASMSHELRTPLNAIGGYADLMLLGVRGAINDAQRTDLERINRSQRHLLSVINDILNFARVEAGFIDYELRSVAVAGMMAEVEPLVLPQLTAKSLAFALDAGAQGLQVYADPEKLRQILLNLLANAIKFTDAGGRVWMTAGAPSEGMTEIRVHDTGIGIPAERTGAVFEPFVQVHRTLAKPVDGTGLGLAISRDLARGMGGDLRVESVPGTGSTFTVTLPRHAPPTAG